jgi:hypothetical protein
MLRARCRPESEELVVSIAERPAAADRHEARVADLREDHALTLTTRIRSISVVSRQGTGGGTSNRYTRHGRRLLLSPACGSRAAGIEDIAFQVIAANRQPDHCTIARFRQRHETALGGLFGEALALCAKAGLTGVKVLAVDGTKVHANASERATRDYQQLAREILEQAMVSAAERELDAAGITTMPEVVLADAGYWHADQMQGIVRGGMQVLIPPDANKRKGPRPGWDGGLYALMRRVLQTDAGGEL